MIRMYHRLTSMSDDRLIKQVFLSDLKLTQNNRISSRWSREVKDILYRNSLTNTFYLNPFNLKLITKTLQDSLTLKNLSRLHAGSIKSAKLITYVHVSGDSGVKTYLVKPLFYIQRKYMAKLRLGIFPLRIKSCRYERPQLKA